MSWIRRNQLWIFGVIAVLTFALVIWIGYQARQKEASNAEKTQNATISLCGHQVAYNDLLDHISGIFSGAAIADHEAALDLALSKAFSEGKVEPEACQRLLETNG